MQLSPTFDLIDLFPGFPKWWASVRDLPLQAQVCAWQEDWMSPWPELLQKQIACYSMDGFAWREVAVQHVFPTFGERMSAMQAAHDHLIAVLPALWQRIIDQGFFPRFPAVKNNNHLIFLIYVGIGCGAGWATTYHGHPAVLFGLENIAECNWLDLPALEGLAAHELGHLLHAQYRSQAGLRDGNDPWWDLFNEGFAQRCEHLFLGHESFHMQYSRADGEWLDWCRSNRAELARQFLELADSHQSVTPFFGSWYNIEGHSQCGYFLGHEIIRSLEKNMTLAGIAVLEDFNSVVRNELMDLTKGR